MPLYDVTNKDVLVNPIDAENYDVIQKAIRNLDARRFMKDVRILDQALQDSVDTATGQNKLVFTKAGILVGHKSVAPHTDVGHLWASAELAYPSLLANGRVDEHAAELHLKFMGGLVRWRISLRPETWLAYRRDSGTFNKFTGKEIKISEYWVNQAYQFEKKKGFSVDELSAKWKSA